MHLLGFLAQYWWLIALGIALFICSFVMIAGRNAEGGFQGRTRTGWRKWRETGEKVANVQARLLLSLFYFTFVVPFGLWQAFISDRLHLRRSERQSFWLDRSTTDRDMAAARRQF